MYVMYACSNPYVPYLGVSVLSLLESNRELETLEVFVFDDGISRENKEKLTAMAGQYGRKVSFLSMDPVRQTARDLGWREQGGSYCTYAKLLADQCLPDYVDRIVYIDASDTLVVGSLKGLETMDMGGCAFAARVATGYYMQGRSAGGFDHQLAREKTYYNCGVFLIHRENWRGWRCFDRIAETSRRDPHFETFDQTIINLALPQECGKILPLEYNFNGVVYAKYFEERKMSLGGFYSPQEIAYAAAHPVILHWPGGIHRPYVKGGLCREKKRYRRYVRLSPWRDEIPFTSVTKHLAKSDRSLLLRYYPVLQFYCPRLAALIYRMGTGKRL